MNDFKLPIIHKFINLKNSREYFLEDWFSVVSNPKFDQEKFFSQIVENCNKEQVYKILFEYKLKGEPYQKKDAVWFNDLAMSGWKDRSYFVFLITDLFKNIVGVIDIKSNDLNGAEIGYWADIDHKGVMTPAVGQLIKVAGLMGYKKLSARVRINNFASQKVLKNNGFLNVGMAKLDDDGAERFWFERVL